MATVTASLLQSLGTSFNLIMAADGSWTVFLGGISAKGPDQATATNNVLSALLAALPSQQATQTATAAATGSAISQLQAMGVTPKVGP